MILYHGSYLEIAEPDLTHSRPNVDFGCGFYVTPLHDQAVKWCGRFERSGKDTTDYDLVIGGVANDSFRSEEALKLLHFERSEIV